MLHIIDILSLLAMLEAIYSMYFLFCFLILIYFIEFDILGTKIKNKRKNNFFGNKGLLVFF